MSTRDFFRRHIFHNLSLKMTALVLSAGLWLAVSSSPPSEVAINVAIIFRNMPPDLWDEQARSELNLNIERS